MATDDVLDALFPGWVAPTAALPTRDQADADSDIAADPEPYEFETEPEALGSPNFRDDVWGPRVPPIRPCVNGYHEMLESECAPGLAALQRAEARAAGLEAGRELGLEAGRAQGLEAGLRRAVLAVCKALSVEVPQGGDEVLQQMDAAALDRWLATIETTRGWPG